MKTWIIGTVFLLPALTFSQISAKWSENPVLVGEHIELVIQAKSTAGKIKYAVNSSLFETEIKHRNEQLWKPGGELEVLNHWDTTYKQKNTTVYTCKYKLIAWDTAFYKMNSQQIILGDSTIMLDIPELEVVFQKKKVKDGIFEIAIHSENDWWLLFKKYWWVPTLLIIAIVGLIFWNKRRKKQAIDRLSLRDRTLLALSQLQKKEDWKHGKIIAHYSAFSSILKMYLSSHFGLNLMERTTQETTLLLKQTQTHESTIKRIVSLLHESDMVKFAKTELQNNQVERSMTILEEIINELSPLELPHE